MRWIGRTSSVFVALVANIFIRSGFFKIAPQSIRFVVIGHLELIRFVGCKKKHEEHRSYLNFFYFCPDHHFARFLCHRRMLYAVRLVTIPRFFRLELYGCVFDPWEVKFSLG